MPGDGQEGNRMFGLPRGGRDGQARATRPEPQRVLGFPVTMFENVDVQFFRGLAHPVKSIRRWSRHRRLGAYAVDEDTPSRKR